MKKISSLATETHSYGLLFMAVFSIFMFNIRIISSPIIFLSHVIIILIILVMLAKNRITLNKPITLSILLVLLQSTFGMFASTTGFLLVVENMGKMILYYVCFSTVLSGGVKQILSALKIYIKICYIVAIIGLFALLSYVFNFQYGYDYSWIFNAWHHIPQGGLFGLPRAQSIFGEPSHAVYVFGPVIFLAVGRILGEHKQLVSLRVAIVILLFLFLTNSTTFYVTSVLAFLLNVRITIKQIIVSVLCGLFFLVWIKPDISNAIWKLEQLFVLIEAGGTQKGINGSSYSAYLGGAIAAEIFKESYGFGGGIGSFEYLYENILSRINVADGNMGNYQTGGSLFVRMIAEFGFVGIYFLIFLIFTFVKGKIHFTGINKSVHVAMFVGFFPFLFRFGTYEMFGLSFFVTVYFLNYKYSSTLRLYTSNRLGIARN